MAAKRNIETVTNSKGCLLVVSHKPTNWGYIRVRNKGKHEMLHRIVYKEYHKIDEIPEGFDIDHMCRETTCCNPEHLQLLSKSAHSVKTIEDRFGELKDIAFICWVAKQYNGIELCNMFDIHLETARVWIREWKYGKPSPGVRVTTGHKDRREAIHKEWLKGNLTALDIINMYGINNRTAHGWVLRWKKQLEGNTL